MMGTIVPNAFIEDMQQVLDDNRSVLHYGVLRIFQRVREK